MFSELWFFRCAGSALWLWAYLICVTTNYPRWGPMTGAQRQPSPGEYFLQDTFQHLHNIYKFKPRQHTPQRIELWESVSRLVELLLPRFHGYPFLEVGDPHGSYKARKNPSELGYEQLNFRTGSRSTKQSATRLLPLVPDSYLKDTIIAATFIPIPAVVGL